MIVTEESIVRNIKNLRKEKRITLEKLAELTGFTKGYLSRIERSKKAPPFSTLVRIATALGVDITYFFTSPERAGNVPISVVKRSERPEIGGDGTLYGYVYESLGFKKSHKKMEPYVVTVDFEQRAEFRHEGEEFFYVLEGLMEFHYGDEIHLLEPGDSAYFDAGVPHSGKSIGPEKVRALVVIFSYA